MSWWRRNRGRTTRWYRNWDPFQLRGAMHHNRKRHCRGVRSQDQDQDLDMDLDLGQDLNQVLILVSHPP